MKRTLALSLLAASFLWGNNVDIPLDSPLYGELERLKSLGAVEAPLPTMKPYNTVEVKSLLKSIENPAYTERKKILARELRRYTRTGPVETSLSLLYADDTTVIPNHDGTLLDDGMNTEASLRLQLLNRKIGIVFTPEYRDNAQNRNDLQIGDAYVRFRWKNLNMTFGREALWMGAGREGTLLFSDNAKPLDMIRLSSVEPFRFHPYHHPILNTIFGAMDFDFFLGRLHTYDGIVREDGTIHSGNPKFLGIQITVRPWENVNIGLYRTAMFGGGGRDESLGTFWDVLFPFGGKENTADYTDPGDQKAGFNVEWYIPNDIQPLKLYGEWAGEDESGMLPYKESYILGILLSDTASIEGLQTSFEHLEMYHIDNLWYRNYIYHDGYTNDGILMGHYNGSNGSRDTLRLKYLDGMQGDWSVAWERFEDLGETSDAFRFALRYRLTEKVEMNVNGTLGEESSWVAGSLKWIF